MKRVLLFLISFLLVIILPCSAGWGEKSSLTPTPPVCPTCCETMRPYPGISADDLMKIHYYVKFTKFARDYKGIGYIHLINKKGFKRSRDWGRYRILLAKYNEVFDYKDLVVILNPQNIKGLSVLTWTYLDPEKDQEIWLWLPSLRKVRRISQSEADDPFMGSELTTEEMSTRKWEDETYKMIGEKRFKGYSSKFTGKTHFENLDCYMIEAKPKKKDWYYSKRVVWLDKRHGGIIYDEVFDSIGRKWKVFLREFDMWDDGCIPTIYLEGVDQMTRHQTVIGFDKKDIHFNTDLKENFFTERTLMRSKW